MMEKPIRDEVPIGVIFCLMDLEVLLRDCQKARQSHSDSGWQGDATLTTFIMNYRNGDDDDGKTDGNN